jgi:hypothetical protein
MGRLGDELFSKHKQIVRGAVQAFAQLFKSAYFYVGYIALSDLQKCVVRNVSVLRYSIQGFALAFEKFVQSDFYHAQHHT